MEKILIIDDDSELCELLTDYLTTEGLQVSCVHNGSDGARQAVEHYDLVILDVMLPGMNGFDVLRQVRQSSEVPVVMLTARGEDIDRIVGLELGADDYLPKPFNPRELVARIRAIQRRTDNRNQMDAPLRVGDLSLDPGGRQVRCHDTEIVLTSVEFSLLHMLLSHAGQVVSREDMVSQVLGRHLSPYDRSIDVHISSVRKKLGQTPSGRERIKTIRGVGYQYVATGCD
ncbi:response regulator transcription factor [uncultured Desulfuromonas sp.]|uniref:response regulator transcription factor n=1 Tax=uncultured Desulfuromonas sp. TaxID=181013 RepID=UPI002AAA6DA5|nr:response regulator transcription factor [uncultured Desulfuromonas sp.]